MVSTVQSCLSICFTENETGCNKSLINLFKKCTRKHNSCTSFQLLVSLKLSDPTKDLPSQRSSSHETAEERRQGDIRTDGTGP